MKQWIQKYRSYLIVALIILGALAIVYGLKGIYPFGTNSVIWSDLHEQVTAFYYHFYDSIKGSSSLLIDFDTSLGINFIGTIGYYIASPFTFLLLLFPRDQIYQAVSIIIALKFITSGITALYAMRQFFPKLTNGKTIFLSLLYAFCGYTLSLYIIPSWMDAVILFPLLCVGLKRLLDEKSSKMYLIILTLSLRTSFYITFLTLLFVFFVSLLYVHFYKEKTTHKKTLTNLGVTTILSLLLSSVIILPSMIQIMQSSRGKFDLPGILESGFGPVTDKVAFFFLSGFAIGLVILLLKDWKKHKKFIGFLFSSLVIVLLPVLIEPINKLWHLGSYAFFPLRFGFIPIFLLLIGAAYYLNLKEQEQQPCISKRILASIFTFAVVMILMVISIRYYTMIQASIDILTLSTNKKSALLLFTMFLLVILATIGLFQYLKKDRKLALGLTATIVGVHIAVSLCFYIGIDYDQPRLTSDYKTMQLLAKDKKEDDIYRLKNIDYDLFMNYGNVSRYPTISHFTSLTDRNNMESLRKIGYSSIWMKTMATSGTMFTDAILANKYLLSKEEIISPYYSYQKTYHNRNFYQSTLDLSYGYFIDHNESIQNTSNAFEANNAIYRGITGKEESLFEVYDLPTLENITFDSKTKEYQIIDTAKEAKITWTIQVPKKQILYLEALKSLNNVENNKVLKSFNVKVNGKVLRDLYPLEQENGLLELGTFENEEVIVELKLQKNAIFTSLTVGGMDVQTLESFVKENKIQPEIKFQKNKIILKIESKKEQILFLPIAYSDNYQMNKGERPQKLFDNFIGISLEEGENEIILTYMPKGYKVGGIVSLITLLFILLYYKMTWDKKLMQSCWFTTSVYGIYTGLYIILLLGIYLLPIVAFVLSYL